MSGAADWTERHRPTSEHQLEGNEPQRRKIREWLDGWVNGQPKKKEFSWLGHPVWVKLLLPEPSHRTWVGPSLNSMLAILETLYPYARQPHNHPLIALCFMTRQNLNNEH